MTPDERIEQIHALQKGATGDGIQGAGRRRPSKRKHKRSGARQQRREFRSKFKISDFDLDLDPSLGDN